MAYKLSLTKNFERDFKSFDPGAKTKIKEAMNEIHHNPASGELLKHNLQGLTSYHFNRKPEMRIIYAVYSCHERKEGILSCRFDDILHTDEELETCNGLIEFLFVKTREELNNGYKVIKDTAARLKRE